jgi:1-deoxy-D-xylulose-5-phosphate reductoisomerase
MDFSRPEMIDKITLTASGGPFRGRTKSDLREVTPDQATNHPRWDMGAKISVDSATLMNKGLELIEAYHLFPVEERQIDVVVHPESIIHSLVHYRDGSVLAQLGMPDMRIPIAYTLGWPARMEIDAPKLDLVALAALHFEKPDENTFPALQLSRAALNTGGVAPIALNAANEVAVARFLRGEIGFLDITRTVESVLEQTQTGTITRIEDVIACDQLARHQAMKM